MSNWITLSQNSGGSGTTVISVTAAENDTPSQRTDKYKVSNGVDRAFTVSIGQAVGLPYFTIYCDVIDITSAVTVCSSAFDVTHFRIDDGAWEVNSTYHSYGARVNYSFATTGIHKIDLRTDSVHQIYGTTVPKRVCDRVSIWAGNKAGVYRLNVPSFYKAIGESAFIYDIELSAVTLHSGLEHIGNSAFYYAEGLTEIIFPETLTEIESLGFYRCCNLSSIYSYAPIAPTLGASVFEGTANNGVLHYPAGSDYSTWLTELNIYATGWTGVADL